MPKSTCKQAAVACACLLAGGEKVGNKRQRETKVIKVFTLTSIGAAHLDNRDRPAHADRSTRQQGYLACLAEVKLHFPNPEGLNSRPLLVVTPANSCAAGMLRLYVWSAASFRSNVCKLQQVNDVRIVASKC